MSNFWKRTIFGAIYVVMLIGCVIGCKYSFFVLMFFLTGGMIFEFLRITMGNQYKYSQMLTILSGVSLFAIAWAMSAFPDTVPPRTCFLAFIPVVVLMINSLYVKDKTDFGKFANVYTSLLYIAIPMTSMNYLVMNSWGEYNGLILIAFFVLIWVSDAGAYIIGVTLGQKFGKKLFPSISPKKSWVGFWGGFVFTVAVSVGMQLGGVYAAMGIPGMTWYHALIMAAIVDVAGVYGDLFESQWKRYYAVKDSGKIIPGHGGLLDRLDSTLFAVPAGIIYLSIFKLI